MTITVRLPVKVEADLRARLDRTRAGLSEFVREAIAEKLDREPAATRSVYDIGKHLFGKHGSGRDDLSANRRAILDEVLAVKHHRRRRPTDRTVRSR
jgi:Arc/MetJ-type ribon-helix-helix transcriptional regulator